jgi:hypothetical protein
LLVFFFQYDDYYTEEGNVILGKEGLALLVLSSSTILLKNNLQEPVLAGT